MWIKLNSNIRYKPWIRIIGELELRLNTEVWRIEEKYFKWPRKRKRSFIGKNKGAKINVGNLTRM